jgi:hypothetical protein
VAQKEVYGGYLTRGCFFRIRLASEASAGRAPSLMLVVRRGSTAWPLSSGRTIEAGVVLLAPRRQLDPFARSGLPSFDLLAADACGVRLGVGVAAGRVAGSERTSPHRRADLRLYRFAVRWSGTHWMATSLRGAIDDGDAQR